MTTSTSSLSNTRLFTAFVTNNVARLNFITGNRASDGTAYTLFEAIDKNSGAVQTIGIGKTLKGKTKAELMVIKSELFISDGTDEETGRPYMVLHLRGERLEDNVTSDFM